MAYCSKKCQITNWRGGHKWECAIFKSALSNKQPIGTGYWYWLFCNSIPAVSVRLLIRLWLLLTNESPLIELQFEFHDGKQRTFKDIIMETKFNIKVDLRFEQEFAEPFFQEIGGTNDTESRNMLQQVYKLTERGCFRLQNGVGFLVPQSLVSPSCLPNISVLSLSDKFCFEIRTLGTIKAGQAFDIIPCPMSLALPTDERNKIIARYSPTPCSCFRCLSVRRSPELAAKETKLAADYRAFKSEVDEKLDDPNPSVSWLGQQSLMQAIATLQELLTPATYDATCSNLSIFDDDLTRDLLELVCKISEGSESAAIFSQMTRNISRADQKKWFKIALRHIMVTRGNADPVYEELKELEAEYQTTVSRY